MKKFIAFLLTAVMLFSFWGCDGSFSEYSLTSDGKFSFDSDYNATSSKSYNEYSSPLDLSSRNSAHNYSSQGFVGTPTLYSLNELKDYLNSQKNKDIFKIPFYYKGSENLEPQMLAQMTNAFYINYTYQGDFYEVEITEYPGEHIADAYLKNDKSSLTADEKKAMDKAVQMVNTAKQNAETEWELELLLHDMIADRVTYYDNTRDFDDPAKAPRYLSIIGALLDGKANCQGYTDAFYTLATMAGFTVSRMSVETKDDLHGVNTILLDGSWYVVDVTFDDQDNGNPTVYYLFNAGLDQIKEIFWKPWKEVNKISATSTKHYYYKHTNTLFNDIPSLAQYAANQWLNSQSTVRGAVKNQSNVKAIEKELSKVLDKSGRAYNYTYWCYNDTKDLYYTIEFK